MSVRSEVIRLLDGVSILGGRVYSDHAPEAEPRPYAVVLDGINQAPALRGDARTGAWRRIGQVDLWEDMAVADQASADALVNALDGQSIAGAMRLYVQSVNRVPDPDIELAHTAITWGVGRLR